MHERKVMLLLAALLAAPHAAAAQLVPDWGAVDFDPLLPLNPPWVANPVLSAQVISDPPTHFVADPFLFRGEDRWWLFFELVLADPVKGVIAVASSVDGVHWAFDRVVLETTEHLSFPQVFRWGDDYYLVPCVFGPNTVRLYRASPAEFPYSWTPVAELLSGRPFADPTIFRHDNRWWMLVSDSDSEMLWLYMSDDLENPASWQEHPASPLVVLDRRNARPAGRVLHLAGDRLIRLTQRCDHVYGEMVRAFEITSLDNIHYAEQELPESPVLTPGDEPWNRYRMHTLDPWWTGERWLCAVDGFDGLRWNIGIYSDTLGGLTGAPPVAPAAGGLGLDCAGWRGGAPLSLSCRLPAGLPASLALYAPTGRHLRNEKLPAGTGSSELEWAPEDGTGHPLSAGLYLIVLRAGEQSVQRKVVLLK